MEVLCCLGLFAGFAVGSTLGGPWTFIAPAAGFGLGLIGDTKLMSGSHRGHGGVGGCCGGGHAHVGSEDGVKDPVCGMKVDEKAAAYSVKFEGKRHYFCSDTCMSTFETEPKKYVRSEVSAVSVSHG